MAVKPSAFDTEPIKELHTEDGDVELEGGQRSPWYFVPHLPTASVVLGTQNC